MKKLTEEFNILTINIKTVNEKLEIDYQIGGFLVISRSTQRP